MPLQEQSIYAGWLAKQVSKGTAATAVGARRVPWIDGDFNVAIDDGELPLSDMSLYGARYRYRNTIQGSGSPNIAAVAPETAYLLWLAHGGETHTAGSNELQTLTITGTPTGGTFTLTFTYFDPVDGQVKTQTTAPIVYNAAASAVDTALEALTQIGAGQITAAGGPLPGAAVTITFTGTLANRPIRALTVNTSALTGGTPAGAVVRTTPGVRNKKLFKPTLGISPHWFTFYRRLGLSVVERTRMVDCLIGGWTIAGGNGDNKVVRITPTVLSLQPGQWQTSDPTDPFPADRPWLYTDAEGTWMIGGEVYTGQSETTVSAQQERTPQYGDRVTPHDLSVGGASFSVASTLLGDQQAADLRNEQLYGTATPAANQAPSSSIPPVVSYSGQFKQREPDGFTNGNDLKVTVPGMQLNVPPAPAPAAGGGVPTLQFAGSLFPVAGQDPYSIEVWTDEPVFT